MNLQAIESFCLVVKMGSISKAAKELHISQPALSLQIQELEYQLDAILLERSNRGVTPTELGDIVNEYGLRLIALANNLRKEIEQFNNVQDELIISTSSTVGQYALPCTLYVFHERYPGKKVHSKILHTREAIEMAISGGSDFAIIEGPLTEDEKQHLKNEGLVVQRIARDELVLIAPYNEEWMDVEEVSIKDFDKYNWILREVGSGIRYTIDSKLEQEGIATDGFHVVMEHDQTSAIISSVAANRGLSILPRLSVKKELHYKSLKAVRIQEFLIYHTISLIYNPKKVKSTLANNFLQLIISKDRGFC